MLQLSAVRMMQCVPSTALSQEVLVKTLSPDVRCQGAWILPSVALRCSTSI